MVVANVELVDSWIRYVVAPAEEFHARVRLVAWPFEPVAGDKRTGAAGAARIVVKLQGEAVAVVLPELFFATTFQYERRPFAIE